MINTILVVLEQALLHLPLMVGAYVSFSLLKVPDLSIEMAYVVGALTGSYALKMSPLLIVVLCASALGGALVGAVSSLLTQKGKLSHLLSSIVTVGLFHGVNHFFSPPYISLASHKNVCAVWPAISGHPELPVFAVIGAAVIVLFSFFSKTQLGYSYAVFGNNAQFFHHYGVSTSFVFISGVMLANALAGLSGYLVGQSGNCVELNMGLGKALLCITALILGKTMVTRRKPCSVLVPIAGVGAYFTLQQTLLKVGFNLKYFTAVQACLVVCILLNSNRDKARHQHNDQVGV
jgi:putative ABC transport system permease protein